MMRSFVLTLLCLLVVTKAYTQQVKMYDRRLRLQTSLVGSLPLGSFSYAQKDNDLQGQATAVPGFEAMISVPVYHGLSLGLFGNYCRYTMKGEGLLSALQSGYASPGFYTTWPANGLSFGVTQAGIEMAQNFRWNNLELEPFVRLLGIGFHDGYSELHIRRKMKADNYEEQIGIRLDGGGVFLYPSLGVRAHVCLMEFLYLTPGVQLMAGKMRTTMWTVTTGNFGGSTTASTVLTQNITTLQLSLGFQLRAGRKR